MKNWACHLHRRLAIDELKNNSNNELMAFFMGCVKSQQLLFLFEFPVAVTVFGYEAVQPYKENRERIITGNTEAL